MKDYACSKEAIKSYMQRNKIILNSSSPKNKKGYFSHTMKVCDDIRYEYYSKVWSKATFINLFKPPYNTQRKGEPYCSGDFNQCKNRAGQHSKSFLYIYFLFIMHNKVFMH